MYTSSKSRPNIDSSIILESLSPFLPKTMRGILSSGILSSKNEIENSESTISIHSKKSFRNIMLKGNSSSQTKLSSPNNKRFDETRFQGNLITLTTIKSPAQINLMDEKDKPEKKKNGILFPLKHNSKYNLENLGEGSENSREFRIKAMIPRQLKQASYAGNRTLPEVTTIKIDTSVEEYMDIRLKDCPNKEIEMDSFYQNMVTGSRSLLPLLIMYFEGLLGTCWNYPVTNVFSTNKQHNYMKEYNIKILLRSGMKKEMRSLTKNFIVVIIFPSSSERYLNVVKSMLKNNFYIDGAYFINNDSQETKSYKYIMNYNIIIEDFKLKPIHQTIIFRPIDLSEKQLKEHCREFDNSNNRFHFNYNGPSKLVCVHNFIHT